MTAKEYLSQAYRLDQRINSKIEQVASLNDLATKCTSTLTGMPRKPFSAAYPQSASCRGQPFYRLDGLFGGKTVFGCTAEKCARLSRRLGRLYAL